MKPRMIRRIVLGGVAVVFAAVLLSSCPNPIPSELAAQLTDEDGPVITITEPTDRSEYSTVVQVIGTITDSLSATSATEVASCSYQIHGTTVAGEFSVSETGEFSFLFATVDSDGTRLVDGTITFELSAVDWSGNESSETVELVPSSTGDVPGFVVEPGDRTVTITWDEIPGAESYSLSEVNFGLERTDVTSPYTWTGLTNGQAYAFQLTAHVPEDVGQDARSEIIEKMPLSSRTFAPWVAEEGYKSITVEWWANPDVAQYTVERALSSDGPWEVRRRLTASRFEDTEVEHNTEYWYRIKPTEFPEIPSDANAGMPGRFGQRTSASIATGGSAGDVDVDGTFAYVASGDGLCVVDVSAPTSPTVIGSVTTAPDTANHARSVTVVGAYAYVGNWNRELAVVDVSEPASPQLVTTRDVDDYVYGAPAIHGSYLYFPNGNLTVFNIEDPRNPVLERTVITTGYAHAVTTDGQYLYVAEGGVSVWSLGDSGDPTLVDDEASVTQARDISVVGSTICVAADDEGVVLIGFDPQAGDPLVVSSTYTTNIGRAFDVCANRSYAYVSHTPSEGSSRLSILNVADPATPVTTGSIAANDAGGAAMDAPFIYLADGYGGLRVVRAEHPENPVRTGTLVTGDQALGVEVIGAYAYVADDTAGLTVVHVADQMNPDLEVSVPVTGRASDVTLSGRIAFVADETGFVSLFDVEDPTSPTALPTVTTAESAQEVVVVGPYAYVADHESRLSVIEINQPADPVYLGTRPIGYSVVGVTVTRGRAYLADGEGLLIIADATDPVDPVWIDSVPSIGNPEAVKAAGSYAYVADDSDGLTVFDLSDGIPTESASNLTTTDRMWDVAISGSYAFAAEGQAGLGIISISDPLNPVRLATIALDDYAEDVCVRGSYVYVADDDGGLQIIQLWEEL